jgi:hypothetical protein
LFPIGEFSDMRSRTIEMTAPTADGADSMTVGHSPEGVPVDVILHARENEISELEVVSHDATKIFSMPTPEMLRIV